MNKFIAFEGLDACGKTTLSSRYAKEKNTVAYSAVMEEAHELRKLIDTYESRESAFLFFLLNNVLKSHAISTVIMNEDVLVDRYIFSTLAYQTVMLGEEVVKTIFDTLNFSQSILLPDVIVFVKADAQTINDRIDARDGCIQWYGDAITQNNCVETAYKKIFQWFNIPIVEVDTSQKRGRSIEDNYQQMKEQVERVLASGCN
ncbi:deoxynucleoside kinase [Pseudoalteromonas carrageenovora]|uniref:deoxynucleoside kinase n=1 Tax=Pseudoalteromonas carrageenovora TaxID=227 RepID=UPI002FD081C8